MANTSKTMINHISEKPTTSKLCKVNEIKLNKFMDDIPTDKLKTIIQRKLPTPSKKRKRQSIKIPTIPGNLNKAIISLTLLDEPCMRRRIEIFIGYCRYKNYSYNTTQRYFQILKLNKFFGDYNNNPSMPNANNDDGDDGDGDDDTNMINLLRPNKLSFVDSGKPHIRVVSMNDFFTFVKYLHENFSEYSAPILLATYTGLRSFEILQFSTYTLYQLSMQQTTIAIKRKQTVIKSYNIDPVYWQPVYNTHLNAFIRNLLDLYAKDYEIFQKYQINTKLFHITPKTLGNRVKSLYFNAVNKLAPNGFGIHSCRNMIAMLMAEKTENIFAIQNFLQHRNIATTRQYIKADFTYTTNEFNRLTNYEFANINNTLERINKSTKPPEMIDSKKKVPKNITTNDNICDKTKN